MSYGPPKGELDQTQWVCKTHHNLFWPSHLWSSTSGKKSKLRQALHSKSEVQVHVTQSFQFQQPCISVPFKRERKRREEWRLKWWKSADALNTGKRLSEEARKWKANNFTLFIFSYSFLYSEKVRECNPSKWLQSLHSFLTNNAG